MLKKTLQVGFILTVAAGIIGCGGNKESKNEDSDSAAESQTPVSNAHRKMVQQQMKQSLEAMKQSVNAMSQAAEVPDSVKDAMQEFQDSFEKAANAKGKDWDAAVKEMEKASLKVQSEMEKWTENMVPNMAQ